MSMFDAEPRATREDRRFRVIAITNRRLSAGDYLERLSKIALSDADAIILREKDLTEEEYEVIARKAMEICGKAGKECILHTFVQTAAKLNCGSIHLPLHLFRELAGGACDIGGACDGRCETDGKSGCAFPEDGKKGSVLKRFQRVGVSVHSPLEAIEAERMGADYVTAGHIFATDCKKGLEPRGIAFLEDTVKSVKIPVYAIGGISRKNLPQVKEAGAAGACVMSQMMSGDWYEGR